MKDIAFYISLKDYFDSIVQYVEKHKGTYDLEEYTVESVKKMLKSSAQETFDSNTADSFRKFFDALSKNRRRAFKRKNVYRLCYALGINTFDSATEFLEQYLGVNPLSPRVLEEFIIIAGYKLNLSWHEVNDLTTSAKNIVGSIPPSPRVLTEGDTQSMANDIDEKISSLSDLKDYISSDLNTYFARTRNTQYMAFFNYIDWESYDPDQKVSKFILSTWDDEKIKSRHERTFNFENEDEYTDSSRGNHLTREDLEVLSEVFPDAFLSYDTYRHLMLRERPVSISYETMLIVLINDGSPEQEWNDCSTDSWEYELFQNQALNFTNEEEFKNTLDFFLENAGCAHLNTNIGFDMLILDALHDTIEENQAKIAKGTYGSAEIKSLYFAKLRSIFKEIAIKYKKTALS